MMPGGCQQLMISRKERARCVVFVVKNDSTRRVCRLYDFTKSRTITPTQYCCVSGKVNSAAGKLYLVIESVRPDNKHTCASMALVPDDGAGGRPVRATRPAWNKPAAFVGCC